MESSQSEGGSMKEYAHQPFIPLDAADLPQFALNRLRRFARIAGLADRLAMPEWQRLARHAVHVAYRDCLALGLRAEAEEALRRARQAEEPLRRARQAEEPVIRPAAGLEGDEDTVAVQGQYVMAVVETTAVGR